ncbi:MAG: GHMP kinase [Nitrospinae bacterium]|nr:GHMP kinase [Nitrospinota bacterium]MZH42412.1 GHMP kinase [Nitrospinota bacterium]
MKSSAPTRIDLAGGTLDIWPLHLFFDNPPTLNAAIDLYATVEITTRKDKRIVLTSRDLGLSENFSSLGALPDKHPLELIVRTLKFYAPQTGLEISTDCQAPQGSGIGGSSALNIALHGALNRLTGKRYRKPEMIEIAKNIETQVINVPAGCQDYFPAMYGGVRKVVPGVRGTETVKFAISPAELTRHFVLCYTGKPRNSGINNWEVTKKAVDGNRAVILHLKTIRDCALEMERVLSRGKIQNLAPVFSKEWIARKKLAPNISTPQMDKLIRFAMKKGALAAKVCGAGGGGCVAFIVPPAKKQLVSEELTSKGGQVLPFRFVSRPLRVASMNKVG